MAIPDPYANENFLVTHIAPLDSELQIPADTHPYGKYWNLSFATYKGLHAVEPVETYNVNEASDKDVDKFIKDANSEYLTYNSVVVGCHLKNVLFRTAWFYSMRTRIGLPEMSRLSQYIDVADKFNGPAILTAEERYSFRTDDACSILGIDTTDSAIDQLWYICRKIMEYKT